MACFWFLQQFSCAKQDKKKEHFYDTFFYKWKLYLHALFEVYILSIFTVFYEQLNAEYSTVSH